MDFLKIFSSPKPVIAMIHVQALPGAPKSGTTPEQIIEQALKEAKIYKKCGVHSIMIENMHDRPYRKNSAGPEIVSMMSVIGREVKQATGLPCGIQILAGANKEALAAAYCAGLDFIRAEGFVFGHLADEGYIDSCAADLLRYRKSIGAGGISILTDIKKKHSSHAISSDVDIAETAKAAEFFLSDGLILTGRATGEKADVEEIKMVKTKSNIPVLAGSGINRGNLAEYFPFLDGFIVGSHFKKAGNWENEPDDIRIKKFMSYYKILCEGKL